MGRAAGSRRRSGWKAEALFLIALIATPAFAEEAPRRFDLSAGALHSIPVENEQTGVKWADLYEEGVGGALELAFRATPRYAFYAGSAYHQYRGREILFGTARGRFNPQKLVSFYLGVKGYLLDAALPQKSGGINPYLRADLGFTQFNGAAFAGGHVADRSGRFSYAIGAGADLLTYTRFIFFLEAKFEDHGTPDQAANSFQAVPIIVGMRYLM